MKARAFAITAAMTMMATSLPALARADHGTVITCQIFDALQNEPMRIQIFHGTRGVRGRFLPTFVRGAYPMRVSAQISRLRPRELIYPFSFGIKRLAEGHYVGSFHPVEKISYHGAIHLNPADPQKSTYVLNSNGTLGSSPIGVNGYEALARCATRAF